MLYGGKDFDGYITAPGRINFLKQELDSTANFAALDQIKKVHLTVSADATRFFCDVQDALFVFFSHLTDNHKLHSLDVHINVSIQEDDHGAYTLVRSTYAERMFKQNIMREFSRIKPGGVSRAHIAVFLTDPIRTVRLVKDGRKKAKFTLDFVDKTGRPWREL